MKEPILYLDDAKNEVYRFTWLRTFHNPIAIRIEKQGDAYLLFWKLCSGAGGYQPGELTINKQKSIDKATWDKFMELINRTTFWTMTSLDPDHGGFDGAQWILEGKSAKQYHVVDRWSPNTKDNFNKCCDFLIHLTDLKIKDSNKY